jgi:arylsulfatase A-like enzyme
MLTNLAYAMTEKPNILLIVGDDIGFGDLGKNLR